MKIVKTISEIRDMIKAKKSENKTVSLVPTMGALHEGHLSLIEEAKKNSEFVVMSIFVNPTQFGVGEDFDKYPRTLEKDAELAFGEGVDCIFAPDVEEIYKKSLVFVDVEKLGDKLCGAKRPGHFKGVATIVTKLFNIIDPDVAVFGLKDAQQVKIIEKIVEDLNFNIKIIRAPIKRDENGLALSSRNIYLSASEKEEALVLNRSLKFAEELIKTGRLSGIEVKEKTENFIKENSKDVKIDYLEILSFEDFSEVDELKGEVLIAIAAFLGKTRLIDNVIIEL